MIWILIAVGIVIGFIVLAFLSDYSQGIIPNDPSKPDIAEPETDHKSFRLSRANSKHPGE